MIVAFGFFGNILNSIAGDSDLRNNRQSHVYVL